MKILIIEDEKLLADSTAEILRKKKYDVEVAYDGVKGEELANSYEFDLVLLDVMLPGKDGFAVLRSLRNAGLTMPVIFLTAKSELDDRIRGLDSGADDYLCKPIAMGELLARIRAQTRRKAKWDTDVLVSGGTTLDRMTQQLRSKDKEITLSRKEFLLLEALMLNQNCIMSKDRLINRVWGFDSNFEYNAIETYVVFLRRKLAAINSDVRIRTVRGSGYVLERGAGDGMA